MMNEKEVRLIDANALESALEATPIAAAAIKGKMFRLIEDAPTIDPESLCPHGKWETDKEDIEWGNHLKKKHCTNCSSRPHYDKEKGVFILTAYCPNCGAKMEE